MSDITTLLLRAIFLFSSGLVVYAILKVVYNLFFHPLRAYPGPLFARATLLTDQWYSVKGKPHLYQHELHQRYGPVVRIAPNYLSFIEPSAWKDIYGHRAGTEEFSKDKGFYGPDVFGSPPGLIRANRIDHARQRKLVAHAFSDKALRSQEQLLRGYVTLLVSRLKEASKKDDAQGINIVDFYNFTTFDIMGDLTFGESLKLLENSAYTPWVRALFGSIQMVLISQLIRSWPGITTLLKTMIPAQNKEKIKRHMNYSTEHVEKRLATETDRPDIWTYILRHSGSEENKDKTLLPTEMRSNGALFMLAGTETTATELSGLTYYLLKNPEKLERLKKEVRGTFASYEDMTMTALAQLEYLGACLEEGLRMYPPVSLGLPRTAPEGGAYAAGHYIPSGTTVSVAHFAAYHSTLNFKNPDRFVPERWLPEGQEEYAGDHKEVLQPFSYGPRNCLGKNLAYHEMRLMLASVMWSFDLELCEKSEGWMNQQVYILWEKSPLMVKLRPIRD